MRIGIAIEWCEPAGGGAERSTHQLATALVARGHAVTVLAGGAPPALDDPGYALETWRGGRKPRSGADAIHFSRWAQGRLFGDAFDASLSVTSIVPAQLVEPRAGLVRASMARGLAAEDTVIARAARRAGHLLSPRKHALRSLERATFADPRVRWYVGLSRFMAQQFREHYRAPEARTVIVRNAAAGAAPAPAERAALRAERRRALGLDDDERVYLFPSRDAKRKGLGPLLAAFAGVRTAEPASVLLVAGGCPPRLRRRAEALGVAAGVRDLGPVPDLTATYCAADATVLPTFYDPASKVVIESLRAGTPAITTRFDGSADWIEACGDERAGRVLDDPRDAAALAAAMLAFPGPQGDGDPFAAVREQTEMSHHVERLEALLRDRPTGV